MGEQMTIFYSNRWRVHEAVHHAHGPVPSAGRHLFEEKGIVLGDRNSTCMQWSRETPIFSVKIPRPIPLLGR